MLCQIYCRLTAGHQAIDADQLESVARYLHEIEDLLQRGIECGALVDPWNIVGFGGNFSLFPAIENSVHDFRVDDLIELVEQILDLCARAWTEAAAIDDTATSRFFPRPSSKLAAWWDKFATASVSGVKRLVAKEIEVSTNLVAGALSAWHKGRAPRQATSNSGGCSSTSSIRPRRFNWSSKRCWIAAIRSRRWR